MSRGNPLSGLIFRSWWVIRCHFSSIYNIFQGLKFGLIEFLMIKIVDNYSPGSKIDTFQGCSEVRKCVNLWDLNSWKTFGDLENFWKMCQSFHRQPLSFYRYPTRIILGALGAIPYIAYTVISDFFRNRTLSPFAWIHPYTDSVWINFLTCRLNQCLTWCVRCQYPFKSGRCGFQLWPSLVRPRASGMQGRPTTVSSQDRGVQPR